MDKSRWSIGEYTFEVEFLSLRSYRVTVYTNGHVTYHEPIVSAYNEAQAALVTYAALKDIIVREIN
jgi:hypothetical protein